MVMTAGQVNLPPDLSSIFSGIGTKAYNQIGQNYGGALSKAAGDASAQGFAGGPTDYTKQRLATTQGLDVGNLEAGLGGGLGNAAYKDTLAQRDYGQQKQLTDIIGNAMAPTTLQEIFAGIGGGGQAAGQMLPLMGMFGGGGNTPMPSGGGSSWDVMNPGKLDLGYPGFGGRGGY